MSLDADSRNRSVTRSRAAVLVIAVVLAVAGVAWAVAASRPRQIVSQRQTDEPSTVVFASGCPVTASCTPNGPVRAGVLGLIRTEFGLSATVTSSAVVDRTSGRIYEETVSVHVADGVDVAVSTRCVNGAAAVTPSQPASVPAVGPADLSAVVPGVAGCSTGVALHAHAAVAVGADWSRALALVRSPVVQLPG